MKMSEVFMLNKYFLIIIFFTVSANCKFESLQKDTHVAKDTTDTKISETDIKDSSGSDVNQTETDDGTVKDIISETPDVQDSSDSDDFSVSEEISTSEDDVIKDIPAPDVENGDFMEISDAPENALTFCSGMEKCFYMNGIVAEQDILVTGVPCQLIINESLDKVLGFEVTLDAPFKTLYSKLHLFRDGDVSDGNFNEVKSYDISKYPYNLHLLFNSISSIDCEAPEADCFGFFGMEGYIEITNSTGTFSGSFKITKIQEGTGEEPGMTIPGSLSGSFSMPVQ
jgi:hypothetical protein